ncbi:cold-regulated protein 28-like isoform X1 [Primulina huaijiensis]|uniref:cold-regulated protein 28-like isoform X1 n=1 Tax=Primulina huaijiensis TaxID=1492673 RepID=UPI003CC71614
MERNLLSGAADDLMLWNAEVSSLTRGDILRRLANVTPDDCTAWTNEKHNSYLNNLEVSFVAQLHESRDLVNKNMTQKKPINSPEQYGCWQNIDHRRYEPLSCPSADSHNLMKNSRIYYYKNLGIHHPSPSADLQGFQKLSDTQKHSSGKGFISHGLATCSQEASAMNLYHSNSFDSMKEGTGQNYVKEDNDKPNLRSGLKKIKPA